MKYTSGIGGWAGAFACEIDEQVPGFLGYLQRSDAGRRQILFAAFSTMTKVELNHRQTAMEIGSWLMFTTGREVVLRCFGSDPAGFRAALKRSGPAPKAKSSYQRLHKAFLESGPKSCGRILQFRENVQPSDVAKLMRLPPFARSVVVLDAVDSVSDAEQLRLELDVIRKVCPSVRDAVLARSLTAHAKSSRLSQFLDNWLKRAEIFPEPPILNLKKLNPLLTGHDMCRAAREYDNCLDARIANVIAGTRFYYEWTDKPTAIVEVSNDKPLGWRVSEIQARNNKRPPRSTVKKIQTTFAAHGVSSQDSWRKNFIWFDID